MLCSKDWNNTVIHEIIYFYSSLRKSCFDTSPLGTFDSRDCFDVFIEVIVEDAGLIFEVTLQGHSPCLFSKCSPGKFTEKQNQNSPSIWPVTSVSCRSSFSNSFSQLCSIFLDTERLLFLPPLHWAWMWQTADSGQEVDDGKQIPGRKDTGGYTCLFAMTRGIDEMKARYFRGSKWQINNFKMTQKTYWSIVF